MPINRLAWRCRVCGKITPRHPATKPEQLGVCDNFLVSVSGTHQFCYNIQTEVRGWEPIYYEAGEWVSGNPPDAVQ